MLVLTVSVHAHILTKPSRAGFAVIRLELMEPGAETCVSLLPISLSGNLKVVWVLIKDGLGINVTMKTFFALHITEA